MNTLECENYHKFLAGELSDVINKKKWKRVYHSPIFSPKVDETNPLIPLSIEYIDILVSDYLCFSTIVNPTMAMESLLRYKNETTSQSIKDLLIEKFGSNIIDYIENVLDDMNGLPFRNYIRNNLKIK